MHTILFEIGPAHKEDVPFDRTTIDPESADLAVEVFRLGLNGDLLEHRFYGVSAADGTFNRLQHP